MLDLPEDLVTAADASSARHTGSSLRAFRDAQERDFILATLKRHNGNISQSAIELGVGRTYLHRRLLVLGISRKEWLTWPIYGRCSLARYSSLCISVSRLIVRWNSKPRRSPW